MPKPALVTVPGVEVAKVGSWGANTANGKPWDVTVESIADAVEASRDPRFRKPVLKIGHDDPRFNEGDGFLKDGSPAVGRLDNFRATDDGRTLVCDLVGVPAWLAEVMGSAYPSRSTEALNGTVPGTHRDYRMVVTGLALLGETAPAIESLADVAALYGVDTDVTTWSAARAVAGTFEEEHMPEESKGSAKIEDLYQAAEAWAHGSDMVPSEAWPREIYTDFLILCDYDGRLWKVMWAESGGDFTFSDPQRVEVTYTPLAGTVAAAAAHAMRKPLSFRVGLGSPAVTASQGAASVELTPAVREALGLDENASEEAVLSAISGLRTVAPAASTETPNPDSGDTAGETPALSAAPSFQRQAAEDSPTVDLEDRIDQLIAARVAPYEKQIDALSTQLAARNKADADARKAEVISAAARAGKFTPADRAQWEADYDANPAVVTSILARMAPGTAVPVAASGYAGGDIDASTNDIDAEYAALLGGGH